MKTKTKSKTPAGIPALLMINLKKLQDRVKALEDQVNNVKVLLYTLPELMLTAKQRGEWLVVERDGGDCTNLKIDGCGYIDYNDQQQSAKDFMLDMDDLQASDWLIVKQHGDDND